MAEDAQQFDAQLDKHYEALFLVRRSVRYHDRRVAHYERLHRFTSLISILLAGFVFIEVSDYQLPHWVKWVAAVGGLLSAWDMVQGFAKRADLHRNLKRRFLAVEIAMQEPMSAAQAQRLILEIEGDEPPIYRAVDLLCHNELCAAEGQDAKHFVLLTPLQRGTANWLKWTNITATPAVCRPAS
jgi:hypothetical protein